jgi:2-dehydro-3-deoxy-D-arabinonate dehydratase
MQLCKVIGPNGHKVAGVIRDGMIGLLPPEQCQLTDILHAADPWQEAVRLFDRAPERCPAASAQFLAPIDSQEVWAAGVTYRRSREARERESVGAARFYDLVYTAARPELFFKATARRVRGPGDPLAVRGDSRWTVPEPEVALVLSPDLRIVGYTIGNDMSARDIEGENPLYLPQAKVYSGCCALGPAITLPAAFPSLDQVVIRLTIERAGAVAFEGATTLAAMARTFADLVSWLGRDNAFPDGAFLLTGTGIVPPDTFALAGGDRVDIEVAGIGRLSNPISNRA